MRVPGQGKENPLSNTMEKLRWAALLALLAVCGTPLAAQPTAAPANPDAARLRRTPVVDVFESTRDSVVNISSTQVIEVRSPFGFDSLFDFRFEGPEYGRRRQIKQTSVGSGFVLHAAGYLVTNAHVVARTAERKAIFADGSEFDAEVVAIDEPHDLAVLKIDPGSRKLDPIRLGSSADLMVGETVIAIGNPLGYQHTVTAGVVSAINRELPVDDDTSLNGLVQTDASINPGNSGGPLLNILGELVGINTAIRADAQNIGFAIPVGQLRELLPGMLDVERRYRVVTGLKVTEANASGSGVAVTEVEPDSPAARAGLRVGESIQGVAGSPVGSVIEYLIALIGKAPGSVVDLTVRLADGSTRQAQLTLGERPRPDGDHLLLQRLGLEARLLDRTEAAELGMPRLRGLLVTGVQLRGPAEAAGLEPGDVLIQLGRHQPQTLDEVGELLEPLAVGDQVDVGVIRIAGRRIYRAVATLQVR